MLSVVEFFLHASNNGDGVCVGSQSWDIFSNSFNIYTHKSSTLSVLIVEYISFGSIYGQDLSYKQHDKGERLTLLASLSYT